jgi:hypothetical protein
MQKTFDLEVDGIKFQCLPLSLTTRLRLDKQLLTLLAPIAGKVMDTNSDLSATVQAMPEILQNLPDEDFLKLVSMTLSTTTAITTDKGALSLADEMSRDAVFTNLLTLYKLLMEIWRFNNLTVFVIAARHNTGG